MPGVARLVSAKTAQPKGSVERALPSHEAHDRDEAGHPEWNRRMLDLSLRAGFEMRLRWPYRAQTKGKVETGVK